MDSFFKTFTLMNLHPVLSVVGMPDLIMITLLLSSVIFRKEEIIWQDASPTLQTTNVLSLEQGRDVLQLLVNGDDWPGASDKMLLSEINYLINGKNVVHIYGNIYMPRTIRLRLESNNLTRDLVVVQANNWPQQSSPLSTVFNLIKLVDEEQLRMTGGSRETPVLVMDRNRGSQASAFCCLMSLTAWSPPRF